MEIRGLHICTSSISPWNTGQVRLSRSSGQGQGHYSKKVANACSWIDQLPSAIFIGTRQMSPQTTRRGWLGLRLEGMLTVVVVVIVVVVVMCGDCACLAGSIHDEGVGTRSGQTNAWMRVCRLHFVVIYRPYKSCVQRTC